MVRIYSIRVGRDGFGVGIKAVLKRLEIRD